VGVELFGATYVDFAIETRYLHRVEKMSRWATENHHTILFLSFREVDPRQVCGLATAERDWIHKHAPERFGGTEMDVSGQIWPRSPQLIPVDAGFDFPRSPCPP
jgi:hypothetical protein